MIQKVKRFENGFILDPIVISPRTTVAQTRRLKERWGFGGFPVTGKSVPILVVWSVREMMNNFKYNFRSTACYWPARRWRCGEVFYI